tara:strand:- start:73 stop:504 length:432 start_codon:yes stop_codon:yes gene_type:complete
MGGQWTFKMFYYSDFDDSSWNSPARKCVWKNFIESHNGIECVGEKCYGLKSAIRSSCVPEMTENQICKVADKMSSQWSHRRTQIINEYKDNKLSSFNTDFTALDRAFLSKPKKENSYDRVNDVYMRFNNLTDKEKEAFIVFLN